MWSDLSPLLLAVALAVLVYVWTRISPRWLTLTAMVALLAWAWIDLLTHPPVTARQEAGLIAVSYLALVAWVLSQLPRRP